MSIVSNRLVVVLVVLNMAALAVVFWLVGLLVWDNSGEQPQQAVSEEPAQLAAGTEQPVQPVDSEPAVPADVVQAPLLPQSAPAPVQQDTEHAATVGKTGTINVYYDGNIVRMEESDDSGNTHLVISNSLDDVGALSADDADYIAALEQLRSGARSHVSIRTVTREEAAGKTAEQQAASEPVDYFNKVDVSEKVAASKSSDAPSLEQQIEAVVASAGDVAPARENRKYIWPSLNEYVQALDSAAGERANETRTIKVRRGDSLWTIAERAYGSGYEYPRIYKANPHLTNPDLIREGDILRVPL